MSIIRNMVGKTARLIAAALFAAYIAVLVILFVAIPMAGDWGYWGEPLRDGLAIASIAVIGIPLLAAALGLKPS